MLDNLLASEIGVKKFKYDHDTITVELDVMCILEKRSSSDLFDQKFGKYILDHVETASLDADKAGFQRLISVKPTTVDSTSQVPLSNPSIVSYPLSTGKRPIIP